MKFIWASHGRLTLLLIWSSLRASAGHVLLSVIGIALGVALGLCVTLINHTAANEFSTAVQSLSGSADLVVRGARAGFPEAIYPKVATLQGVQAVSPGIDLDVSVPGHRESLEVLCLDPFQEAAFKPTLAPQLVTGMTGQLLSPDAVLLSNSAAESLHLAAGSHLSLQAGLNRLAFKVTAVLPAGAYRQQLALMDIATCQWRFSWLGRLNRLDIRLAPGIDRTRFAALLGKLLPAGTDISTPAASGRQAADMTTAYRINLDVLSWVALFTGIFLVFATQSLSVIRRRRQLALLRVLGATQQGLFRQLLAEGAMIGICGATIGVLLGDQLSRLVLQHFGAELGAGYFSGIQATPETAWFLYTAYFVMGVGAALLGTLLPALETSRLPAAQALKSTDPLAAEKQPRLVPGMILWTIAAVTAFAPPVYGLPWFGYLSIACLLFGAIAMMPRLITWLVRMLPETRHPLIEITFNRLRVTAGQATVSVAAILVSFSLMVSMSIMIVSFRGSLADWLDKVLPADLYVRAAMSSDSAWLPPVDQARMATTPGVKAMDFLRIQTEYLQPGHPPVTLIARNIRPQNAGNLLALTTRAGSVDVAGAQPAWISEAVSDIYHWHAGQLIHIPINGHPTRFYVAGIWRDYARQTGAIVINSQYYIQQSGDRLTNEAAVWVNRGVTATSVATALRARLPGGSSLEIFEPGVIRLRSLQTFDRTFAITYLLEAMAVLIGLFGISSSFSAQALARRSEFGMLRHLGFSRMNIGLVICLEAALTSGLRIVTGLGLGALISLILIEVVNRQSFHWSMDWRFPGPFLLVLGLVIFCAAIITAVVSGRRAMSMDVIRAVKEDW